MSQAEADQTLGDLHTDGHRIEHGDARPARELGVVAAQVGARQDHHLRAIFGDDPFDLLRQLAQRALAIRDALLDVDADRASSITPSFTRLTGALESSHPE